MGSGEARVKEKEIRRNDIIEAAEAVFFAKGYQNTTMDDIAKAAEFSKRTLYMYFNSKEQLYFEIMIRGYRVMQEMLQHERLETTNATAIDSLVQMGSVFYRFSRLHPEYFTAIIEYETAESDFDTGITDKSREECYRLGEATTEYLIGLCRKGIDEGEIRQNLNPVQTALVLWSCVIGVVNTANKKSNYLRQLHATTPDELVMSAFNLMVESIKA